jgi:hypothetical protein
VAAADQTRLASKFGLVSALLAAVCALILFGPSTASASSAAVCDQYPDLPQCQSAGGGGGGGGTSPSGGDGGGGGVPGSADTATGSAATAGELPFTGYPLTPLVLFLVILVTGGLTIRAYVAARDRLAAHPPHPGP